MRACVNVLCVRVRVLVDACWSLSLWSCVDGLSCVCVCMCVRVDLHVSRVSPVCVHVRACRSAYLACLSCVCLRVRACFVSCVPPQMCVLSVVFFCVHLASAPR